MAVVIRPIEEPSADRARPQGAPGDAGVVALTTHGTDDSVIADVLYAVGDERLVISVAEAFPRRELATELITDVIAMHDGPLDVLEDLQQMADQLGWTLAVATRGARTDLTIS
jgi:hypothetical protein